MPRATPERQPRRSGRLVPSSRLPSDRDRREVIVTVVPPAIGDGLIALAAAAEALAARAGRNAVLDAGDELPGPRATPALSPLDENLIAVESADLGVRDRLAKLARDLLG